MADIKSPEARSLNMSKIQSRDTKPEMWLRKRLFERGYQYRKNANNILGHPDAWLAKYKTAIFVHGCFWHRHRDCKYAYMPKSRVNFWQDKFQKNTERDQKVREELLNRDTKMLIVWECTVKKMMRQDEYFNEMIDKIEDFLHSRGKFMEI